MTQMVEADRCHLLTCFRSNTEIRSPNRRSKADLGLVLQNVPTFDPAVGNRAALVEHLRFATLAADHLHAIKLASGEIDDVPHRVQDESLG